MPIHDEKNLREGLTCLGDGDFGCPEQIEFDLLADFRAGPVLVVGLKGGYIMNHHDTSSVFVALGRLGTHLCLRRLGYRVIGVS